MYNSSLALKSVRHKEIQGIFWVSESSAFLQQETYMMAYQKHLKKKVSHQRVEFHQKINWSSLFPMVPLEKSLKLCLISCSETIFQMPVNIFYG